MPCRNVLPKPLQKPHPPMWLACTNRQTIEIAARNGLGALAFTFVDPDEARTWADAYYSIIKSDDCVPLGHSVNANIAVVAGFSLHEDPDEARRRGVDGFAFFRYAINALVANDTKPGRSKLWEEYEALRDRDLPTIAAPGIGTPFIERSARSAETRSRNSTNPYPSLYPVCLLRMIFADTTFGAARFRTTFSGASRQVVSRVACRT